MMFYHKTRNEDKDHHSRWLWRHLRPQLLLPALKTVYQSISPLYPHLWNQKLVNVSGCCQPKWNNMRQPLIYTLNQAIWVDYGESSLTDPFS